MTDSDIRDQTYQFFLEEVPELLDLLETALLNLKSEHKPATVHDLMRAAHSIKGGAATVGLQSLASIAHRLESIFRGLYSEKVQIDSELETGLLQSYDCLREPLQKQMAEGRFDEEAALIKAETVFSKIEARMGDAIHESDSFIPSSTDLGVDMISSIFDVDVGQGIERLAQVLSSPQQYKVEGELRAQADVFAGFAEILNLPGFGAIAEAAVKALDANPNQALEVLGVVLADFQNARALVLAGDRAEGGSVSPALKALLPPEPIVSELLINQQAAQSPLESTESVFSMEDFDALIPEVILEETEADLDVPLEALIIGPEDIDQVNEEFTLVEESISFVEEPITLEHQSATLEPEELNLNQEEELNLNQEEELVLSAETPQGVSASAPMETVLPTTPTTQREQKNRSQPLPKSGAAANFKVKVSLSRLEKMNDLVGELVINRNSMALQQEQLQAIVRKIKQRLEGFQELTDLLQGLSTDLALAPVNRQSNIPQLETGSTQETGLTTKFDSLEMDSYGDSHSSIQEGLEEIMQLEEAVEDLTLFVRQSDRHMRQQQQTLTKLRDELMWARMLPLETILKRFPRTLRDLSSQYHKPVELEMDGTEILIDKGILDKLHDPLRHLIRNAFDHGIEPPEERSRQGKPSAKITIKATHQGNRTLIEISDNGRGLNLEKVAQRALERGWLSVTELTRISKEELLDFIFEPGFSTADRVSELSGRGVGLDIVRSQLQKVKGTVSVNSVAGEGTTFTLSLPLTLTIAKLLVCSVGDTLVAIPVASIQEISVPEKEEIKQVGDQKVLLWREQMIPVHQISDLLEYRYPASVNQKMKAFVNSSTSESGKASVLIVRSEKQDFALEVEGFGREQEMVIKPLTGAISPPNYIYGCTVLGDGSLIPAINAAALLAYVREQKEAQAKAQKEGTYQSTTDNYHPPATTQVPTVLVADDSSMMRRTLDLTLRKVGYRVLQARDGWEALEILQQNSQIELIVSDLEMPNLNGFELLAQLRKDPQLCSIPTVMLTTRSTSKHRKLALHLGAKAYLSKPYIEQEFLAVLKTIINREQKNAPALPSVA